MKKLMKKLVILVCVLSMVMVSALPVAAASKKQLNKSSVTVAVGCTTTLKAYGGKAKWSSSDKKVATVNKKGVVTAKKQGTAVITAKIGSTKLKCKVKVKKNTMNPTVDWNQVNWCTRESLYFIQATPIKMWYDSKNQFHAQIAVKNSTYGMSYTVRTMTVQIYDANKNVIAEGTFANFTGNTTVNGLSTIALNLTFDNGSTKQIVDLTKLETFYYAVETSQN